MLSTTFSQLLGYSSIACWLCAQFPQVVENIRRQSCEGLALPFLTNWLLGDVSNLVGCILTHQLPFQTYLAVYFVFVDITIVVQYLYYYLRPKPHHHHHHPSASRTRPSVDRARYRALSVVAANVAASAALVAQQDEHVDHRRRWPDADDNALAALADSFHSETGHRKTVSWSIERHRQRSGSVGCSEDDSTRRGRPLERGGERDGSRLHSMGSRRTMVFLGVWALFGVGTIHQRERRAGGTGVVLSGPETVDARVVGRIFAWLCTTLYLTSRLPQIWKNYVRKSVEGLSMYLFVFAFLGNSFYVASILTSPDWTPELLRESIPYLLGSGGTLMFDVVIVSQSLLYRGRRRRRTEEEEGLL
ncbi:hypothetical protein E4T56_gene19336 [Termitomyces sp. T112]|nr:hypothetical protein E4T56_gene19336 [Termitomyces sp. T112]